MPPPGGTCYLAEQPLAALLEITRGLTILSEDFLAGRKLFSTKLTASLCLADMTAASAYGFGVTGELSASADYSDPHVWARGLRAAGFQGVRYHVRHDPRGELVGVAWFGRAGRRTQPPAGHSEDLPAELLLAATPFGIKIANNLPAEP